MNECVCHNGHMAAWPDYGMASWHMATKPIYDTGCLAAASWPDDISAVCRWGVPLVRRGVLALLSPSRASSGVATSLEDDDCRIYLTSLLQR